MTIFRLFQSAPCSADTDANLLARFVAERDELAFTELLRRHGPLVYRVCRRLLDASLADDAFQAAFLVLATRANRVRKSASVGSWLIGVAGRVARQMRRRRIRFAPDGFVAPAWGACEVTANPLETADLARVLDEELTHLPEKLRAVAVVCLVNGRTQADAAGDLGESERTIRRRVLEAKQLLRERLERRGVVPAVAGGLIAGLGATAMAVPVQLVDSTACVVFDFLAGGATVASVPVALAKGVAMSGLRKTLAASVAVFALGLSVLGVGLADEQAKPPESKTIPPQNVPLAVQAKMPAEPPKLLEAAPRFVVTGGDAVVNRVVQREAEHLARVLGKKWTGKPLPPLKDAWRIVVKVEMKPNTGSSTFIYAGGTSRGVLSGEMRLCGSLEEILRVLLPHELTHCVLAAHFGRPLPRWVDEGIALLSEPAKEQEDHDIKSRKFANAGRAIQLKHLLPMTEYPKDMLVLYAQGHSVARFLHERDAKKLLPLIEASFADGWDKALQAHYGFKNIDALEEAWLAWLKKPESVLKAVGNTTGLGEYKIEAPDLLRIQFDPKPKGLPTGDEYLVRPDGTVSLGTFGSLHVDGLTIAEVPDKVRQLLGKHDVDARVTVNVIAFNSKYYYIFTDFEGNGEKVIRLPVTGNETVQDAIRAIGGLADDDKKWICVMRPGENSVQDQILPVDWKAITSKGNVATNYQLLPGDRVYVKTK